MKTFMAFCGIATLIGACHVGFNSVKGSGNIITQNRTVEDFTIVNASGPMDVEITMGNNYKVEVEADDNLMSYIIIKKKGDELVIKLKDDVNFKIDHPVTVRIQTAKLREVIATGSGNIKTIGLVNSNDKIETSLAGSGNITMEVNAPEIESSIAGSGNTNISGQTRMVDISIAGSGSFNAADLKSEKANVSIAGSGDVKIFASVNLDVSIVGSGDVIYSGTPNISKSVIGSGSIKSQQ
jgi:hypothetical protein